MTLLGDENVTIAPFKAIEQTPQASRSLQPSNSQLTSSLASLLSGTGRGTSMALATASSACLVQAYRPGDSPTSNASGSETIQVIVRVRPRKQDLWRHAGCVDIQTGPAGTVTAGSPAIEYKFDHVAGEDSTQEHIFEIAGERIVDNFLAGFNGCIMAYGQTGSGKTYTMTGIRGEVEGESRGIVQRALEMVFSSLERRLGSQEEDLVEYKAEISLLEIYNERLSDLLNPAAASKLTICSAGGGYVDGLTAVEVSSACEAMELLHRGMAYRQQASTGKNDQSSRSHAVFTLRLTLATASAKTVSKLHLVDLAGSERVAQTGAEGARLAEAGHINKSLSALGQYVREVIKAQRRQEQGKEGFVPSRGNPLTHLLKDSFGGNAKTAMVANLSPDPDDADHTVSTLKFASDVKGIRSNAVLNRRSIASGEAACALARENERLRQELAAAAAQQELAATAGQQQEGDLPSLREEVALLREQNERLQVKLAAAASQQWLQEKELPQLREMLVALQEENERLQQELAEAASQQGDLPSLLEEVAALREENDRLQDELEEALAAGQHSVALAEQLELPPAAASSSSSSPEERPSSLWEQVALLREENEGLRQELAAATARKEATVAAGMPLLVAAVARQEEENDRLRKELAAAASSKQQLATAASRQEEELSSLMAQVARLRQENERLQELATAGLAAEPSSTEDKMSSLWEQVSTLEGENERLRKELESAKASRQELATLAHLQDEKVASLREELADLHEEKRRLQQELSAAVAQQGDLPSLLEEVAALREENDRLKQELAEAKAQQEEKLSELLDGMAALREELQASECSKEELDEVLKNLRTQLDRAAEEHQQALARSAAEAEELQGEKEHLQAALDASEDACARLAAQRAATHVALAALSLDIRASQSALAAAELSFTTAYEAEEKARHLQRKRQAQVVVLRAQAEAQAAEAEKLRSDNQRLKCELEFVQEMQQKAAEAQARQQRHASLAQHAEQAQQAKARQQQHLRAQGSGRSMASEGQGEALEAREEEGVAPLTSLPLVQLEAKQRQVAELQAELAAAKAKSQEALLIHRRTLAQQHSLLWEVQWELEVAARELRKTYGQCTPLRGGSPGGVQQGSASPGERRAAILAGMAGKLQAARLSLPTGAANAGGPPNSKQHKGGFGGAGNPLVVDLGGVERDLDGDSMGADTPGSPDRGAFASSSASTSPCSSLSTEYTPDLSLSPTWYTATSRPGTANASPCHFHHPHPAAAPLPKGAGPVSPPAAGATRHAAGAAASKQLPMLPEGVEWAAAFADTNSLGSSATRALWAASSSAPPSPAASELPIPRPVGTEKVPTSAPAQGCTYGDSVQAKGLQPHHQQQQEEGFNYHQQQQEEEEGFNHQQQQQQQQQRECQPVPTTVACTWEGCSAPAPDSSAYLARLQATRAAEKEDDSVLLAGQAGGEGRALGEVHKTLCSLAALVDAKLKEVQQQLHSAPGFGQDSDE